MRTIAAAVLALAAGAAHAQADPADPKAKAPPVQYKSAFGDYKPFREPDLENWRQVNEEMRRLGGHQGHSGARKPAAQKPASGEHGAHGGGR